MQSRDRALYQYALLSLAILQADFGCFSEAVIAMQETIATARENHDMPCLNYSLSWLYHFGRAHQEEMTKTQEKGVLGSEKEALAFLKAKAKESDMWPLLSTTLLSEARDEIDAGENILAQLQATPVQITGLQFNISMVEVELQTRRGNYSNALVLQEQLVAKQNRQEADISQRLEAMLLKARIFDRAGIPQKGFSVAIRVASLAHKARVVPVLWEAVGALCRILVSVKQFDAAVRLLESVLPQALECDDGGLAAYLFSCLADGHMGLAGQSKDGSLQRKERLSRTLESLDRAFTEYSRIEDTKGQCEMLAKKATIMHLNGDPVLANDCAAKYLDTRRAAKE
ncbi:MAG: hypothetical protein Q9212_000371 [Teloschistes hypoglaucus]